MTQNELDEYYLREKRQYLVVSEAYPWKLGESLAGLAELRSIVAGRKLVLSFDFHDTLTRFRERVMTREDARRLAELVNTLRADQEVVPVIHSVGNIFALDDIDPAVWHVVTESHILGTSETGSRVNLLADGELAVVDSVRDYVRRQDGIEVIDDTRDEILIRLSSIPSTSDRALGNDEITQVLSEYFPAELVHGTAFWINRAQDVLGIHARVSKNLVCERLVRSLGQDPGEYVYLHFGDHIPDIPWEGSGFASEYLVAPWNSSGMTKDYASLVSDKMSPEFVFEVLEEVL